MKKEVENYPAFKYHATEKPVIVNSQEEEIALGKGWENSPAYFNEKPKVEAISEEEITEAKSKKGKK